MVNVVLQLPVTANLWLKSLGQKVGSHLALFPIHQMNRVNSYNSSAMTTAP